MLKTEVSNKDCALLKHLSIIKLFNFFSSSLFKRLCSLKSSLILASLFINPSMYLKKILPLWLVPFLLKQYSYKGLSKKYMEDADFSSNSTKKTVSCKQYEVGLNLIFNMFFLIIRAQE